MRKVGCSGFRLHKGSGLSLCPSRWSQTSLLRHLLRHDVFTIDLPSFSGTCIGRFAFSSSLFGSNRRPLDSCQAHADRVFTFRLCTQTMALRLLQVQARRGVNSFVSSSSVAPSSSMKSMLGPSLALRPVRFLSSNGPDLGDVIGIDLGTTNSCVAIMVRDDHSL
jgi:hypothetical protein